MEGTYGGKDHPNRQEEEKDFLDLWRKLLKIKEQS